MSETTSDSPAAAAMRALHREILADDPFRTYGYEMVGGDPDEIRSRLGATSLSDLLWREGEHFTPIDPPRVFPDTNAAIRTPLGQVELNTWGTVADDGRWRGQMGVIFWHDRVGEGIFVDANPYLPHRPEFAEAIVAVAGEQPGERVTHHPRLNRPANDAEVETFVAFLRSLRSTR